MSTKVYVSEHCGGCQDLKDKLTKGNKGSMPSDIEVISIDTDEGFKEFSKEVLDHGNGEVPSAYKDGKKCEILYAANGGVKLKCSMEKPQVSPEEK